VGDPTWQYPPGVAPLFVAAGSVHVDYRWGFTLAILVCDAALMAALLWTHARRPEAPWRGPWMWALAGVIVGPIMLTRFDTLPTLFAAVAVLLAARPLWSGLSAGLGFTTKVWPALMLVGLRRRDLPRGLLGFVIAAGAVLGGFALLTADSMSFLANQKARGLQVESVGALPYEIFTLFGGRVAFGLKYGSIQVLMAGAETTGLVLSAIGLVVLGAIIVWRLLGRMEQVPPGDVAVTVLLVSLATSRVYSPQFNVWLVGVAAAAALDRRTRLGIVPWIIIVIGVLTQFVYPWSPTQLIDTGYLAITVQAIRIALLITAVVLGIRAIVKRQGVRPASVTSPIVA
jgi:hypothetical protein